MRSIIATTLASAFAIVALAGAAEAGNRNGGKEGRSGMNQGVNRSFNEFGRSPEEKQRILDMSTTGSIRKCPSRMWDEYGRCIRSW